MTENNNKEESKNSTDSKMQSPWDHQDFEWDHKLPEWKSVQEMMIPEAAGTSFSNQTLFMAVKTRLGRGALRFALTLDNLKIEYPVFLDACESALLQHHNYQIIYRRKETLEARKEKAAVLKAEKLRKRTAEREAAAEAKKSALYEKEVARQEKARLREQKIAQAAARRIHAQLAKSEKNASKKRKISPNAKEAIHVEKSSDEDDSSANSSSADDEDSDPITMDYSHVGDTRSYFAVPEIPILQRSVNVDAFQGITVR